MKRASILLCIIVSIVGCGGDPEPAEISVEGMFCIGEGYLVNSVGDVREEWANCEDPIEGGKIVVELADGTLVEAETDVSGRFVIEGIPADRVAAVMFAGGRRAGAFEIAGPAGPEGVLQSGSNELYVELPATQSLPDGSQDEEEDGGTEAG